MKKRVLSGLLALAVLAFFGTLLYLPPEVEGLPSSMSPTGFGLAGFGLLALLGGWWLMFKQYQASPDRFICMLVAGAGFAVALHAMSPELPSDVSYALVVSSFGPLGAAFNTLWIIRPQLPPNYVTPEPHHTQCRLRWKVRGTGDEHIESTPWASINRWPSLQKMASRAGSDIMLFWVEYA